MYDVPLCAGTIAPHSMADERARAADVFARPQDECEHAILQKAQQERVFRAVGTVSDMFGFRHERLLQLSDGVGRVGDAGVGKRAVVPED